MIQLLKIKSAFFGFVARFELYVFAAVRFVIAYVAFSMINSYTGYMTELEEYPIVLIFALLCTFLPTGVMMFFGAVLILLQFYALSSVLCLITAMIFVLLFGIYLRFTSRKGLYTVLTPMLSVLGIPYAMPVAVGLFDAPYTALSVVCGEVTYFLMKYVIGSAALFASGTDTSSTKSVITLAATEILTDKEMYLYLGAFFIAAIIVYCIRKLPVDQSHLAAAVVGIVVQLILIGGGEIYLGNSQEVTKIVTGCIVSLVIMIFIIVMTHSLDYSRVERLQFEDDEYCYYVKAVPKSVIKKDEKKVKHIHKKKSKDSKKHRKTKPDAREIKQESLEEQVLREFRE